MHQLSNVQGRGGRASPRAPENHTKAGGARSDAASGTGVTEVTGDGMRQRGRALRVFRGPAHTGCTGAWIWAASGALLRSVQTGVELLVPRTMAPGAWSRGISPSPQLPHPLCLVFLIPPFSSLTLG